MIVKQIKKGVKMGFILTGIVVLFILAAIATSIVFTKENHYSFITIFGKYHTTLTSGLGFKMPFVSAVDKTVYLGLQSHKVEMRLKTSDQVTFKLNLNIQYVVSEDVNEAYKAMYNIRSYFAEMSNIATNASISLANNIEIENVFNEKETILDGVHSELDSFFSNYGITIKKVLSDEPELPKDLEEQANEVMKAKRQKEAATHKAAAIKIEKVGAAEADGESVKIRMNKLGESRREYAIKSSESIEFLVDAGCSADSALKFLNQIGEQDAVVTSSRNGSTIIFHDKGSDHNSTDILLANMIDKNKEESDKRDEDQDAKELERRKRIAKRKKEIQEENERKARNSDESSNDS